MSLSDFVRKFEFVEPDTKSLRSFVNACHLFNLAGGAKTDEEALLEEHPYTFVPGNVLPTLFGVMHIEAKSLVTQLDQFSLDHPFEEETEETIQQRIDRIHGPLLRKFCKTQFVMLSHMLTLSNFNLDYKVYICISIWSAFFKFLGQYLHIEDLYTVDLQTYIENMQPIVLEGCMFFTAFLALCNFGVLAPHLDIIQPLIDSDDKRLMRLLWLAFFPKLDTYEFTSPMSSYFVESTEILEDMIYTQQNIERKQKLEKNKETLEIEELKGGNKRARKKNTQKRELKSTTVVSLDNPEPLWKQFWGLLFGSSQISYTSQSRVNSQNTNVAPRRRTSSPPQTLNSSQNSGSLRLSSSLGRASSPQPASSLGPASSQDSNKKGCGTFPKLCCKTNPSSFVSIGKGFTLIGMFFVVVIAIVYFLSFQETEKFIKETNNLINTVLNERDANSTAEGEAQAAKAISEKILNATRSGIDNATILSDVLPTNTQWQKLLNKVDTDLVRNHNIVNNTDLVKNDVENYETTINEYFMHNEICEQARSDGKLDGAGNLIANAKFQNINTLVANNLENDCTIPFDKDRSENMKDKLKILNTILFDEDANATVIRENLIDKGCRVMSMEEYNSKYNRTVDLWSTIALQSIAPENKAVVCSLEDLPHNNISKPLLLTPRAE